MTDNNFDFEDHLENVPDDDFRAQGLEEDMKSSFPNPICLYTCNYFSTQSIRKVIPG